MLKIKLVTGDTWSPDRAMDYNHDHDGGLTLLGPSGEVIASVGPNQWVYVEIPPEAS